MKYLALVPIAALGVIAACTAEPEVAEAEAVAPMATETMGTEVATPVAGTSWDANSDGRFERAEYTAYGPANFNTYDTNRDNRIDQTEFNTGWTNTGWRDGEGAFGVFDTNRDTYLDNDEFFSDSSYTSLDADNDGALSSDEWLY